VDAFFRTYQLGYHPAALHALSLDPDATVVVWSVAASLALLLFGLSRAIRYVRLGWLVSELMGLGVALAVIGVVQRALTDVAHPRIYGFWVPLDGGSPFGPFVNKNHFAGWMLMTIPLVAAYAWALLSAGTNKSADESSGGWLRWSGSVEGNRFLLISVASLVMAASLILTASRSGLASFGVVLVVLGWFMMGRLKGVRRRATAAAYLTAVLLGALLWAGSGVVFARFSRAPEEAEGRFAAWRDTVRIVHDFGVFGTGLGGYRTAMLNYQTADRQTMYEQAHNDYLQLAAEGGLLVCVPAGIALAIFVVGVRRRLQAGDESIETYWIRRGAVAGLIGIGAQSLVEFSLQMPGNTVLFVLLAAIAFHRPRTLAHARRI
jgi:O-antigen ligase